MFKNMIDSFNYAISGIVHGFKTQRNLKIHFTAGILVIISSIIFRITRLELIAVLFSITLVVFAELINTALEHIVDMITEDYHPSAQKAKNVAAGAVLVTALNALLVGFLVFYTRLWNLQYSLDYSTVLPSHLMLGSMIIVLFIVIMIKSARNTGNYLQGGMPSGHTALSFSLFASITLFSGHPLLASFAFIQAILVTESRLEANIHTVSEVVVGAMLGFFITVAVYAVSTQVVLMFR